MFGFKRRARLRVLNDDELAAYVNALMEVCDKRGEEWRASSPFGKKPSMFNRLWLVLRVALGQPTTIVAIGTLLQMSSPPNKEIMEKLADNEGRNLIETTDELKYAVKELQRRVVARKDHRQ